MIDPLFSELISTTVIKQVLPSGCVFAWVCELVGGSFSSVYRIQWEANRSDGQQTIWSQRSGRETYNSECGCWCPCACNVTAAHIPFACNRRRRFNWKGEEKCDLPFGSGTVLIQFNQFLSSTTSASWCRLPTMIYLVADPYPERISLPSIRWAHTHTATQEVAAKRDKSATGKLFTHWPQHNGIKLHLPGERMERRKNDQFHRINYSR